MANQDAIEAMRKDLREASTARKDEKKKVIKTRVTDAGIKRHTTPRV